MIMTFHPVDAQTNSSPVHVAEGGERMERGRARGNRGRNKKTRLVAGNWGRGKRRRGGNDRCVPSNIVYSAFLRG